MGCSKKERKAGAVAEDGCQGEPRRTMTAENRAAAKIVKMRARYTSPPRPNGFSRAACF